MELTREIASELIKIQGLDNIIVPNTYTKIGHGAFSYEDIREIFIPNSIISIDDFAFEQCKNLVEIRFERVSRLESIGDYVFSESGLKSINIPDTVTEIGRGVFWKCQDLIEVKLPRYLIHLEEELFAYCSSLRELTLPSEIELIDYECFWECSQLSQVTLSISNTKLVIDDSAFGECPCLKNVKNIQTSVIDSVVEDSPVPLTRDSLVEDIYKIILKQSILDKTIYKNLPVYQYVNDKLIKKYTDLVFKNHKLWSYLKDSQSNN